VAPPSEAAPRLDAERAALELERLALENRKLRRELDHAGRLDAWEWIRRLSPVLATALAVAGFLFGVYQFGSQQKAAQAAAAAQQQASREATELQSRRDLEARDRDFMKPLWERELNLFFQASDVVATIATTQDPTRRRTAEQEFWKLYEGPLVIVESQALSGAMKRFGECLGRSTTCSPTELRDRSRALATVIQKDVQAAANRRLSDYSKGKFQYH
jgi:hypothetical protein